MPPALFSKVLIANRSEIAVRVIHACRTLGIKSVAVYSEADRDSKHTRLADESVGIGPPPPRESYLVIDKIIAAARETGCQAIHPGYGFLAENADFAEGCQKEGLTFIGPTPESMRLMGNKIASRVKMAKAGVPLIPGMTASADDLKSFQQAAEKTGFPVMVKAAAGGGGKGMRTVEKESQLEDAIEAARREALNAFGDDTIYLEKLISNPRHIEFQILADNHGHCVHLFERECSIQRRHQKIIEETPSTALDDDLRRKMGETAVNVARAAGYTNAGTVEFLLDSNGKFYFLEMNTRIQVEHPITEMVTGVDLVIEQFRIAAGEKLSPHLNRLTQRGHAIECRLYAEDGDNNFMPATGKLHYYREPAGPGIRVDSGVTTGTELTIDYDPIMSKLIVHAPDRNSAITKMTNALIEYHILGVRTSKRFMIEVLNHPEFIAGKTYTNFIERHMTAYKADSERLESSAAAVATAVALQASKSMSVMNSDIQSDIPTPWQTLGAWQIGDAIVDQA